MIWKNIYQQGDPHFLETTFAEEVIANQKAYGRKMDAFIYYVEAMNSLTSVACEYNIDPTMDLDAALIESMNLYNGKFFS